MFSSRWRLAFRSNWNPALRRNLITKMPLGPVRHQVPGGMLDPNLVLRDGRTALGPNAGLHRGDSYAPYHMNLGQSSGSGAIGSLQ